MLLKSPEKGGGSSKSKKVRNITLFFCALFLMLFIGRFVYIYQKQTPASVTLDSLTQTADTPASVPDTSTGAVVSIVKNISLPIIGNQTPVVGREVGIALGSQLTGLNDTDLEKEVSGLQALGVKLVRFDIEWGFVQYSSSDTYTWTRYDRIINALNAHGIKGVGIITYTPEWARTPGCRGGAHCPPNDPKQYATFAAAVVNRYKSKGMHYWEIWNEPNDYDFWATKSDCVAYTNLLKATYPVIKKADPKSVVITGGLAQVGNTDVNIAPLDFLQCVYTNGGHGYFDAVGYHPYTFPQLPSASANNAWGRMSLTSPSLRSIMIANGDADKKIWMTEYGTPTNGPDSHWYVSEDNQSQMLTDTINLYQTYDWAGPLFWYTYKDGGTTKDTNENFFGLVRADYSQKPAYQTMQSILSSGLK